MLSLLNLIESNLDGNKKAINLQSLNKSIDIENKNKILIKMKDYLHDIDIVNQILPDFTHSPKISDAFG